MKVWAYLPSTQFVSIALSLIVAGGVVGAAQYATHLHNNAAPTIAVGNTNSAGDANWQATLSAIEAQNATAALPTPDPTTAEQLLNAAQTNNLTESIGRSLLINLTSAKSQGLGDDIPTQNQIIAAAAAQIATKQASPATYTYSDLTIAPVSASATRAYGNGVMQALAAHPQASEQATLLAIDKIVEGGDTTQASTLAAIGAAYKAAAKDLAKVAVPQTLAPLDLQVINNLLGTSATYEDMQVIGSDPVRGLSALQTYETLMDSGARVFTNIAQELNKDGILFSKDEPGSAWAGFLPTP